MRIVFLGSGAFGIPTLELLAQRHEILAIVSQPDRPAGRRRTLTPTPIAQRAAQLTPDAPILRPERIGERSEIDRIRALPADAFVIIAYGQYIPASLIEDRFAINLHASLLPRWRGAAPINHAILAGDAITGNSVITIDRRMDAGLVLGQNMRPVPAAATAGDMHDTLALAGPDLVERVLREFQSGALRPQEQDESIVTLAPKLSRADAWVDLARPAEECRRRINGLSPWPGVSATLDGLPLKLLRAVTDDEIAEAQPGTIVDASEGLVACAPGRTLRLLEVQPAGGRAMLWKALAAGRRIADGASLIPDAQGSAPC